MFDDYLKPLPVAQVAAWYRRLADLVGRRRVAGREPYASILLRHYLDNRDPKSTFKIENRTYLRDNDKVIAALAHHRRVFLSEEKAHVGTRTVLGITTSIDKLGGIVPRLKGDGFTRQAVPGQAAMHYESLVQIGDGPLDILRIQTSGSDAERDLFTSLRGFQLHSEVLVKLTAEAKRVRVDFASWQTDARDRYDWDYSEHLTMPNPDFGSKAPEAVRPMDRELKVYHSNAKRLEDAKLAAPYDVQSAPWAVMTPQLSAPALVL